MKKMLFALLVVVSPVVILASDLDRKPANTTVVPAEVKEVSAVQNVTAPACPCTK